jgi:hypothetical protein
MQQVITVLEREGFAEIEADESNSADLVWCLESEQDTLTTHLKQKSAVCANLLGTDIFEDKAHLAILQRRMKCPTLESHVCRGIANLSGFLHRTFRASHCSDAIWIVKQANSNGGEGLSIVSKRNWRLVVSRIRATLTESLDHLFVVQHYVSKPLTWGDSGRKFHFRVYAMLRGDLSLYVFPRAFAHVANDKYDLEPMGSAFPDSVHITNVSRNSSNPSKFFGYHVSHLPDEFPGVWESVKLAASEMVAAASPFLHQISVKHFSILGLDILPDSEGGAWLLEANVPPCMGSQVDVAAGPARSALHGDASRLHDDYLTSLVRDFIVPDLTPSISRGTGGQTPFPERDESREHHRWELVRTSTNGLICEGDVGRAKDLNEAAWLAFQIGPMNTTRQPRQKRILGSSQFSREFEDSSGDEDGGVPKMKAMRPSRVVQNSEHVPVPLVWSLCDGSADIDD